MAKYTSIYTGEELDVAIGHAKDDSYFQRKLTAGTGISLSDQTISLLIKKICTTNTSELTPAAEELLTGTGTLNLHRIAKTGSYSDLRDIPSFATVATSGSYSDLINIPFIGSGILTLQASSVSKGTFSANAGTDVTINFELTDFFTVTDVTI